MDWMPSRFAPRSTSTVEPDAPAVRVEFASSTTGDVVPFSRTDAFVRSDSSTSMSTSKPSASMPSPIRAELSWGIDISWYPTVFSAAYPLLAGSDRHVGKATHSHDDGWYSTRTVVSLVLSNTETSNAATAVRLSRGYVPDTGLVLPYSLLSATAAPSCMRNTCPVQALRSGRNGNPSVVRPSSAVAKNRPLAPSSAVKDLRGSNAVSEVLVLVLYSTLYMPSALEAPPGSVHAPARASIL